MAFAIKFENQLLERLSEVDLKSLRPHLTSVGMGLHYDLEVPNKQIKHVYFMESGFASVVATSPHTSVEVGLIGREGMSGSAVIMGNHRSPHATYIQAPGMGKCIPATELRKATQTSVSLRDSLLKFAQAFGVQTTHTAVSNAQSRLDVRLARWLLMAHDRIGDDTLPLTHEFLSLMLGVRRPGVTEALHALRKQDLISYARGQITVKNRKRLERAAGKAYGTPEAEYRRLIG